MQPGQILTADLLDILFDGKNKDYGAYQLRKTYNNRLILSLLVVGSIILLFLISYFFTIGNKKQAIPPLIIDGTIDLLSPADIKPITITPPAAKSAKAIRTQEYTKINIVDDRLVTELNKPPLQPDLDNVKIGLITQDGAPEEGITAPDASKAGTGNGTASANTTGQGNGDESNIFRPIEIESEYPGGQKAWSRFLNRTLGNSYPTEAFEKGIQGTVVIQFVVDIDGTVSNIAALTGPEELREAAINTIKKSGKWKPAIQNGRNVKTYKRQPITFILQGEQS